MSVTQVYDPNMVAARKLAEGLGSPPVLPSSMQTIESRSQFADAIDGPLVEGGTLEEIMVSIGKRIAEISAIAERHMPDVNDPIARLNIALRLWSGCLSAAKTIALETRSGPNTPESRQGTFANLDIIAQSDPIFNAGMEVAPAFKKHRGEPVSFEGVPASSPVRKFAE